MLELTREDGDRLGEAHSLRGIGEARWRQGQWEAAEFVLLQALEVAKEVSDRFLRARIETDLGLSSAVRGSGDAVRWLTSARAVFAELGAVVWRERVDEALTVVTAAGALPVPPDGLVRVLEG